MSVHVSSWVWKHSKAKGTQLLVLLSLADMSNDEGECWPSIKTIRERCRVSERAVQENLRASEAIGEIQILKQEGRYGTNMFLFTAFRGAPNAPLAARGEPQRISGVRESVDSGVRRGAPKTSVREPSKKTTKKDIVVASSVSPEEKRFRDWMAGLANEFGLSKSQVRTVESYVPVPGETYIEEKAALTRSEERKNAGGFFMKALRDDYKPKKRIEKQKAEKPAVQGEFLIASDLTDEERAANIAKLREAKKAAKEAGPPG